MPEPQQPDYLDDDDELLPQQQAQAALANNQDELDFENAVSDPNQVPLGPDGKPLMTVNTPQGPMPIPPAWANGGLGDDSGPMPQTSTPSPRNARPNLPQQPPAADYEAKIAQTPVMTHPPWWQQLAARAVGAAAGVSNAASRTRNPIDVNAVKEDVLHPNFRSNMEEFQSQLNPIQQGYNIEAQRNIQAYKNRQTESKSNLEDAQAVQAIARAGHWDDLSKQRYLRGTGGEIFDRASGQIINAPPSKIQQVQAMQKAFPQMPLDQAFLAVFNPSAIGKQQKPTIAPQGSAVQDEDGNWIIPSPKVGKQIDPLVDEMRKQRMQDAQDKDATSRETAKSTAIAKLLQQRQREIDTRPDQADAINSQYLGQIQGVQNQYEQGIRQHRGTPEHQVVTWGPDGNPMWKPAQSQTNAPAQRQQAAPQKQQAALQKSNYSKFATNGKVRLGLNTATNKWEPVAQ